MYQAGAATIFGDGGLDSVNRRGGAPRKQDADVIAWRGVLSVGCEGTQSSICSVGDFCMAYFHALQAMKAHLPSFQEPLESTVKEHVS